MEISAILDKILFLVNRDKRKVILCNLLFFGSFIASSILVDVFAPELHEQVIAMIKEALQSDPLLSAAAKTYLQKKPIEAFAVTFLVILFLGSLLSITLPGLVFMTIPMALYRAILWGIMFPATMLKGYLMALPVILLEGEGYAVAMVPGINLSLSLLKPEKLYGTRSRREALAVALREIVPYYVLVALVLLAAAFTEVFTVISLLK